MPCISSSSDEEELTCLLDVVGKGEEGHTETNEKDCKSVVVKQEVKVKVIPRVENLATQQDKNNAAKVGIDTIEEEKRTNVDVDDILSEMSLVDQVEILKKDICALLVERERMSENDLKTAGGAKEEELRAELFSSYEKLENAKAAKEQLRLLYRQKETDRAEKGCVKASKEEFERMKEEYFGKVVEAGQLEEKMKELKHEVREANKSVANLRQDVQIVTGRYQEPQNPWVGVGVPYGSTAGRSVGSERDRYGRVVQERSKDQRVYGKRQMRGL